MYADKGFMKLLLLFSVLSFSTPVFAGPHHGGGNGGEEDAPQVRRETGGGVEVRIPETNDPPISAPDESPAEVPQAQIPDQNSIVRPPLEREQVEQVALPEAQSPGLGDGGDEQEANGRNYDPESCEWVPDMPRRILQGPSCGRTPSRICSGYVICNLREGEGRFIRMSTCSPELCGQGDAKACTKDRRYFSSRPTGETRNFMNRNLRDVIRNGSSVRQQ